MQQRLMAVGLSPVRARRLGERFPREESSQIASATLAWPMHDI
jgi:hypothetical protein